MGPEITVLDNDNTLVGKTFARRAKALVAKGRAHWTDANMTAVILAEGDEDLAEVYPSNDREIEMVDLRVHGGAEPAREMRPRPRVQDFSDCSDDLLMHLAKERVRRRKVLRLNALAFLPVLFVALLVIDAMRTSSFGFGFFVGLFFVWGAWIVWHGAQMIYDYLMNRYPKPNEVEVEFKRLKASKRG